MFQHKRVRKNGLKSNNSAISVHESSIMIPGKRKSDYLLESSLDLQMMQFNAPSIHYIAFLVSSHVQLRHGNDF